MQLQLRRGTKETCKTLYTCTSVLQFSTRGTQLIAETLKANLKYMFAGSPVVDFELCST